MQFFIAAFFLFISPERGDSLLPFELCCYLIGLYGTFVYLTYYQVVNYGCAVLAIGSNSISGCKSCHNDILHENSTSNAVILMKDLNFEVVPSWCMNLIFWLKMCYPIKNM